MSFRGNIGTIKEISRTEEEVSVEWQVPNVCSLHCGSNDWYYSEVINMIGVPWFLKLWPKWMNEAWSPTSGWLRLGVRKDHWGLTENFHIRVGIKGLTGVEKEREIELSPNDNYYVWDNFCSRFMLTENKARLMVNARLTITCVIKIVGPGSCKGSGESSMKREILERTYPTITSIKFKGKEEALEDFGKLFDSGEGTDVIVQVSDVEFRAHRLILLARSPVFSAMLSHDTAERASSRIVIDDCEPEAFKAYLQYLYTGSIQSITEQNVFSLYQVADKYLAENLKRQCLKHIQDCLNINTFYDTMQLALVHSESALLEKVLAFASENIFLNSFYFKQNLLA